MVGSLHVTTWQQNRHAYGPRVDQFKQSTKVGHMHAGTRPTSFIVSASEYMGYAVGVCLSRPLPSTVDCQCAEFH